MTGTASWCLARSRQWAYSGDSRLVKTSASTAAARIVQVTGEQHGGQPLRPWSKPTLKAQNFSKRM